MSGASLPSVIGALYVGRWGKEQEATIVESAPNWHVCIRETRSRKRIVAVVETLDLAERLVEAIGGVVPKGGV